MKTILFVILIISANYFSIGQILLEKSYNYSVSSTKIDDTDYYFLMDVAQQQCSIYNSNHEIYKTISISIPSGYYLTDIKFVSDHLFNADDEIELLYIYEKYVSSATMPYYQYGLAVINENGSQLLSVNNGGWAEIKKFDDETKLLTYQYIINSNGYYDISTNVYQIGGSVNEEELLLSKSTSIYPNPVQSTLSVRLNHDALNSEAILSIFSINGKKVFTKILKNPQHENVDIGYLSNGVYVYSIKNRTGIIESSKLIIDK